MTQALEDRKENVITLNLYNALCVLLPVYGVTGATTRFITWLLDMNPSPLSNYLIRPFIPHPYDIYGDNLDHFVHTYHRTTEKKGKDIHWFLILCAQQRIAASCHLSSHRPQGSILSEPNENFLPGTNDLSSLRQNYIFHVMEALVKYVPGFQNFKIPSFIPHPHVAEMSRKSTYDILDLLDKSENKMDDMIEILQYLHRFIPSLPLQSDINVLERLVFVGDQLTNERVYSAQMTMINAQNKSQRLHGIIHRPEGLHLCMNFCKYIVQTFHSKSSAGDAGTLYNLSVIVDRTHDVELYMTNNYSSTLNFIQYTLDSRIVAAALPLLEMSSIHGSAPSNVTNLATASECDQLDFIINLAEKIVDQHILIDSPTHEQQMANVVEQIDIFDTDEFGKFACPFGGCSKTYASKAWLKSHLKKIHSVYIEMPAPSIRHQSDDYDGKKNYASAFMRTAMPMRDTVDSYRMGDGDHVFMFLHFSEGHHIKYRLWTWRMTAYNTILLSEAEAYTYRWNIAINLSGGARKCIANDHLVEINVHKMKEAMRAMGANVSHSAARRVAKCLHAVSALTDNLARHVSGRHTHASVQHDVSEIADCLSKHDIMNSNQGRQHNTYPNFPADLLQDVNMVALCQVMDGWKKKTHAEMQL